MHPPTGKFLDRDQETTAFFRTPPMSSRPQKSPPSRIMDVLRTVFLFRGWPEGDLKEIAAIATTRRFERNRLVFKHGEECHHLFVVLQGRVQMSRISFDGRETVLAVVNPGELLACSPLFLDHAYPASAKVMSSEAILLQLDGRSFLDTLRHRSDLSFKMIAALAVRVVNLAGRIESQASESAEERVTSWLLSQIDGAPMDRPASFTLKSTKKAQAEELGMTPETFSRMLTRLRKAGAIRIDGKELTVLDAEELGSRASS